MRVGKDYFAKQDSFLGMEKDFSIIINKMLKDDDLMRLLYYSQPDCLEASAPTMAQRLTLINKNILLVPKIDIDMECPNYVVIRMGEFKPNESNPEFRDCEIAFNILCHPDHWNLGDFKLRPYKIAGRIDTLFNEKKLTGIGTLHFMGTDDLVLNNDLMGIQIMYQAIRGVEDEINPLN